MGSISIHPPRTPVTKGSNSIAAATVPNVCKMPAPPAPFVPVPLPNIAKSGMSPKGYSKKVKFDGNIIAIKGATFKSMGDIASKGTGGGLISANTHGPAKFISPGSLTVKVEGKSVHLLGDAMLNNCGPSGSPPNTGATLPGVIMAPLAPSSPLVIKSKKASFAGKMKRRRGDDTKKERKKDNEECKKINWQATIQEYVDELIKEAEANDYEGFSLDNVLEILFGGHPTQRDNLR